MVGANKKNVILVVFVFFQLLKPIFIKFPKRLQIGHNEIRTVKRLDHFGQENQKLSNFYENLFFSSQTQK
jgi:hypothetical protein